MVLNNLLGQRIAKINLLSNGKLNHFQKNAMRNKKPLLELYTYEKEAWSKNSVICGIDEVGRGCLAGPVVTCSATLNPNIFHPDLQDSKNLSQRKLQEVYNWLINNSIYSIGINSSRIIDQYNIYQATAITMKQSLLQLLTKPKINPSLILVDAMPLTLNKTPYELIPCKSLIKGESKSASIAAASIIAKVTRDNIIKRLCSSFPQYQLAKHKGYATKQHRESLAKHDKSIIHRKTFIKNFFPKEDLHEQQQTIFC